MVFDLCLQCACCEYSPWLIIVELTFDGINEVLYILNKEHEHRLRKVISAVIYF